MNKELFKGYDVVSAYPEDGYLKGYFYAFDEELKNNQRKSPKAYRDTGYIKHKDYVLHLLNVKKGEKILDLGCAQGSMMIFAGLLGAEVYGIDISSESVEQANGYLRKFALGGKAIVGDARKMNFADNYFDKVVSSDFFEHLSSEDNIQVLKEIKRVLKPDGIAIIKTPNLVYLRFSKVYKMFKRAMQFKNPFSVVIVQTTGKNHQHIGLLSKSKMAKIIKSAGFLNFKFYYDRNSKVERVSHFLGELFTQIPCIRDIFNEELIVKLHKSIIMSFFP